MALSPFVREFSETHHVIGEMRNGGMKMLKNSGSWTGMLYPSHSPQVWTQHTQNLLRDCSHSHSSIPTFECASLLSQKYHRFPLLKCPFPSKQSVFIDDLLFDPHSSPVRELLLSHFTDRGNGGSERRNDLSKFVQWTQDYNLRFLMHINTGHQHVQFFTFLVRDSFALPCPLEVRCGLWHALANEMGGEVPPKQKPSRTQTQLSKFSCFKVTSDVPGGGGSINLCGSEWEPTGAKSSLTQDGHRDWVRNKSLLLQTTEVGVVY